MASYNDKMIAFNPYIQQLPVDAMVKVGMEKQRRYDEGIQKIQTQVDNVAGLDIAKDSHKQYLQSKLNELGSRLKTVAAGDFSNYQLVNSTAGMTSQIAKDPVIQNAVYSTQVIRKGQKELDTAKKEGKSSVTNESDWNTKVSDFLSDSDINTTFNGKYVPYKDVTGKLNKLATDMKDVEYSYDQPYKTNADGSVRYFLPPDKSGNRTETTKDDTKGSPMIDDAMKSITTKGKSAQSILNTFYDNITADDQVQLDIDAAYHYKNATPDSMKNVITSTYTLQKKQVNDYVTELGVKLKDPKLSDKDKAVLQAKYNTINEKITNGDLDKEMISQLKQLENPSDFKNFKTKLYTQQHLTNLAQDNSIQSYKEELKNNPYAQMNMEKQKFQFDVQKENNVMDRFNADHKWDVYKWTHEFDQKERVRLDKLKGKEGSEPITTPGGINTAVEPVTSITITDRILATEQERKIQDADFLSKHKSNIPGANSYTQAQLDVFATNYDKGPDNIKDNDLRIYLEQRRNLEHSMMRDGQLRKAALDQSASVNSQIDNILQTEVGVLDSRGREIYSAKELFTLGKDLESFERTIPGTKIPIPGFSYDESSLMKKFTGTKYEPLAKAFIKYRDHQPITQEEKIILSRARSLSNHFGSAISSLVDQKLKIESDYLTSKTPETQTIKGTLDNNNKEDMRRAHALISDSMNPEIGGLDSTRKSDWDGGKVTGWLNDPKVKDLDYRIIKNYDGSGQFIVQHGKEQQIIPLTAKNFQAYFPRYAEINPVTQIKNIITKSPTKSTNVNQKGDPTNAEFTGASLPMLKNTNYESLVRYDIEGASSVTGGPIDCYQIRVYAFDGKIWHQEVITQKGYVTDTQLQDKIDGIGMDIVNHVLKQ